MRKKNFFKFIYYSTTITLRLFFAFSIRMRHGEGTRPIGEAGAITISFRISSIKSGGILLTGEFL